MRVLHLLFACLMVVLVAVALTCAFATLDAEMEVGPVAACFSSLEPAHNSASEPEAPADFDDANRCVGADRASLTFTFSAETETHSLNGNCTMASTARSDNESARVLKLPQDRAGASPGLALWHSQRAERSRVDRLVAGERDQQVSLHLGAK